MLNFLIIFCAKYLLFISLLVGVVFWFRSNKQNKKAILSLGMVSSLIALIITEISARFIYDPRPFVVKNIQPLIQHAADNGFPSDHTLVAALIAAVIYYFNKRTGTILFIFALLIGISRIAANVHHPLDVIGSLVIVVISFLISKHILKKYL